MSRFASRHGRVLRRLAKDRLRWKVSGATVAGASHTADGRGADDAFAYAVLDDGISIVVAVADGAGSHTGTSAHGAATACAAIIERAETLVAASDEDRGEDAVREAFAHALATIGEQAARMSVPLDALSTTLAVAVLTPRGGLVAQVGDGIIVCEVGGRTGAFLTEIKEGFVNETWFINSPDALVKKLRVQCLESPVTRFALSTDGLKYAITSASEGGAPFVPFFEGMWSAMQRGQMPSDVLEVYLDRLGEVQTRDDKTLVTGIRGARVSARGGSSTPPRTVSTARTR